MKLGDICKILNGRNQKKVEDINGKYPIYGSGGIMGYANDYICKAGTTIIGRKGSINKPLYVDKNFWNVDTAFGLQPKECCNSRFLFYLCKSIDFARYDKGVTIPSLVKSDLLQIPVSIPSLSEQSRIVEELDQLSNIIEKKRQQLSELDNLAQSIFYDMFGDPVTNEKGWEVKKLGEVGFFARGVSKHRPRNAPALLGGSMPLIQTGDVANSGMYITDYNSTYSELGVQQSKVWEAGTLCITIAATIGKCSILTFDACFPDSVVGYIGKKEFICNEYVYYLFGCLQSILEANAPAVAQKNINLKVLNLLEVPLPPLQLQQLFAQKIEAIEKEKELIKQSIKETEELFNSRMDYYFN